MPEISYLCDPWIPEGLNLTVARPKLGKSTLMRQKAVAVAMGGEFLGERCREAKAAILSLEEGDRLTRAKLEAAGFPLEALRNVFLFFSWRRGADGVLDLLRFLDEYPAVRYVGIDSLTRFRSVPDARTPAFQADYNAVAELHAVAKARPGLAIDLIHHSRKAKGDDPLDDISGTYGISAACDSYSILRHHEDGAVVHVGGRLWARDTTQYQLRRANQRWELAGEFTGMTPKQAEVLRILRDGNGLTPSQVAQTLGGIKQHSYDVLQALVAKGYASSREGRYYSKT